MVGAIIWRRGKGFFLWVFFFNFFFFVCDFYQNTEIRHTHKPALKRSSIYSSAGTCPPGQLPAGGVGEEVSHVSRTGNEDRGRGKQRNWEGTVDLEHQ